jgi:hypothetical protein
VGWTARWWKVDVEALFCCEHLEGSSSFGGVTRLSSLTVSANSVLILSGRRIYANIDASDCDYAPMQNNLEPFPGRQLFPAFHSPSFQKVTLTSAPTGEP